VREDVALDQGTLRQRAHRVHALDHQAGLRAGQAGARTQRRVLAALHLDAELTEARVPAKGVCC
jgi:hypothetical protein